MKPNIRFCDDCGYMVVEKLLFTSTYWECINCGQEPKSYLDIGTIRTGRWQGKEPNVMNIPKTENHTQIKGPMYGPNWEVAQEILRKFGIYD
jgi:anaerobic ribonucleoside-triphosphate reductase